VHYSLAHYKYYSIAQPFLPLLGVIAKAAKGNRRDHSASECVRVCLSVGRLDICRVTGEDNQTIRRLKIKLKFTLSSL
jgi:hypothetical protein